MGDQLVHWLRNNNSLFRESAAVHELSKELSTSVWYDRILRGSSWMGSWTHDASEWVDRYRQPILEALFRTSDVPDERISGLIRSDDMMRQDVEMLAKSNQPCKVSFKSVWGQSGNRSITFFLPDVALASVAAMHVVITLDSALHPFGIETKPPDVAISGGSVQLSVSGGLFASGLSLLVASAEGLISTPLAIPAGIALGAVGAIDLIQNWKKRAAEIELLRAEQAERWANRRKLIAEAEIADAQARELRAQVGLREEDATDEESRAERQRKLETERRLSRLEQRVSHRSERSALPSASGHVELGQIQHESTRLQIPTWLACHLLNRTIPAFVELSRLSHQRVTLINDDE